MAFNIKDYKLPEGALIRFGNSRPTDQNGIPYLTWTFSRLGIQCDDVALVIEHSAPIYLKVLFRGRIVNLDMGDMADMSGYVNDISLVMLPNGSSDQRRCEKWYTPGKGYRELP